MVQFARIAAIGTDRSGEKININTFEGYCRIFKRGMIGAHQHSSERHLHVNWQNLQSAR